MLFTDMGSHQAKASRPKQNGLDPPPAGSLTAACVIQNGNDSMHQHTSFFQRRQKPLMIAASLYVVGLILSHSTLPSEHVWIIAAVFSVVMNFTYITEAYAQGRLFQTEATFAVILVSASVLGVLVHPIFVIGAVFGHGLWDLAKHLGAGILFFSWYTLSCAAIDFTYGTVLLAYFLHG